MFYGVSLVVLMPTGFPSSLVTDTKIPYIADRPVGEDAYYMLTVAWNIAEKGRIVYNYDLVVTGIQPLSTFVYAGFAWFVQFFNGSKWMLARIVLVFNVINLFILAHLIGCLARQLVKDQESERYGIYDVAFTLTIFNFGLFEIITYSLETGIYLVLFAGCIIYSLKCATARDQTVKNAVFLGILAGFAGLARIDFGVCLFLFFIMILLLRQVKISFILTAGIVAFLIVIPWILWIYIETGKWIASSGSSEAAIISSSNFIRRFWSACFALLNQATPWAVARGGGLSAILVLVSLFCFCLWGMFRNSVLERLHNLASPKMKLFLCWFFALTLLGLIYFVCFHSNHFYNRYYAPLSLIFLPLIAIVLSGKLYRRPKIVSAGVLSLFPVFFFCWALLINHSGGISNSHTVVAGFIQKEFPSSVKTASFQSGVIGYFLPNVVNLDGKMNSAVLDCKTSQDWIDYLNREKIDVIFDWGNFLRWRPFVRHESFSKEWEEYRHPVPDGRTRCFIRKKAR